MKKCKKILSMAVVMLILSMCFSGIVVSAADNLATGNPGFENGLSNSWANSWSLDSITSNGGTYRLNHEGPDIVDKFAHGGNRCLEISFASPVSGTNCLPFPSTSYTRPVHTINSVYEVSIWVNTGDAPLSGNGVKLTLRTLKTSATGTDQYFSSEAVADTHGEWVKLSVRYTAPKTDAINYVYVEVTKGTVGTFYIDDLSVCKVTDAMEDETSFGFYSTKTTAMRTEIECIYPDKPIMAVYNIGKEAETDKEATMITGLYKKDGDRMKLMDVHVISGNGEGGEELVSKAFAVTKEEMKSGTYIVKSLIWSLETGLRPVEEVKTAEAPAQYIEYIPAEA